MPHAFGAKHHKAKLDANKVRAIRRELKEGKKQIAIAAKFGVSSSVIRKIRDRESWAHVI